MPPERSKHGAMSIISCLKLENMRQKLEMNISHTFIVHVFRKFKGGDNR